MLCMGIIVAPLEEAKLALTRQLSSIKVDTCIFAERHIDWGAFFAENGLNYDILNNRIALFKINESLTAYTCNAADGWWTLYSLMLKDAMLDGYLFRRTIKNEEEYCVSEMRVWHSGTLVRHVRAMKAEDGWEFLDEGSLAAFENAELYKRRKVADRLNQAVIEIYSSAAGFPISSVVKFEGPAVIFSRR